VQSPRSPESNRRILRHGYSQRKLPRSRDRMDPSLAMVPFCGWNSPFPPYGRTAGLREKFHNAVLAKLRRHISRPNQKAQEDQHCFDLIAKCEVRRPSRTRGWLEANRRRNGYRSRDALPTRQRGFQNSRKGFLNLVRMASKRILQPAWRQDGF